MNLVITADSLISYGNCNSKSINVIGFNNPVVTQKDVITLVTVQDVISGTTDDIIGCLIAAQIVIAAYRISCFNLLYVVAASAGDPAVITNEDVISCFSRVRTDSDRIPEGTADQDVNSAISFNRVISANRGIGRIDITTLGVSGPAGVAQNNVIALIS